MFSLRTFRGLFGAGILGLILTFSSSSMAVESCATVDEDAYVLYFYGLSDAKVLLDQNCEAASGEASMDKMLDDQAECRCYDKKLNDVLTALTKDGGPVSVTTRKVKIDANGLTCKAALQKCEQECVKMAEGKPKSCSNISVAGVSSY